MICRNLERSEESLSDQVVVERQCLDIVSEAAASLLTEHAGTLSIETRELISIRKRFSMLYKITLIFKTRQGVDRFIRGASWI